MKVVFGCHRSCPLESGTWEREARVERAFRGSKPRVLPLDDPRTGVGPEGLEPSSRRLRGGCCSSSATNPICAQSAVRRRGARGTRTLNCPIKSRELYPIESAPQDRSGSAFAIRHDHSPPERWGCVESNHLSSWQRFYRPPCLPGHAPPPWTRNYPVSAGTRIRESVSYVRLAVPGNRKGRLGYPQAAFTRRSLECCLRPHLRIGAADAYFAKTGETPGFFRRIAGACQPTRLHSRRGWR